jgi:tetratricopeptide (TPR) repeat protein
MPSSLAIRLLVCTLIAVMTVALSGCGGARARYASHLQRGKEYLATGNLEKAGVEFRNAIQIQPKEAEALYLNGRVAEQRGNGREAGSQYQAAIEANASYEPARASLGKLLVYGGAAQRALDTIAPGLTAHPDDADLLAVRAAARHELKDDVAAQADAERAVQVAPTNENAIAILAALEAAAGDRTAAISLVSGAVNQVPASTDLREVLANLYLATDQPDKAEEQMRKIIELKPNVISLRAQLAMHLARARKIDAAQRVLEEAVEVFSTNKEQSVADQAKLLLVDFVAAERSRTQGEKVLREFIAREPDNLDLRLGLGALLQRTGAAQDAITAYREVVKRDEMGAKGLAARDRVAAIEVSQGRSEEARKLLAEVLQKSPRDDDALTLRATLELQANDPTAAIGDLRAVLRDQPNSIPLQQTLARAYLAKGEPPLAEEALRAAMQSAPNNAGVRIDLAELLVRSGRAAEGVALLEETVNRIPGSEPAREALIKAYLAKNDLPAARAAAEDLKTKEPRAAAGFYLAGLIAAADKHFEESEKNLEHALELQPDAWDVLGSLARIEASHGAYDVAIGRVRAAIDQHPNNIQLLDLVGGLYLGKKDFARAADIFTRESAQDPHLWQAHRNLALVRLATNDSAGAAQEYQAALKIAPTESQLVADAASFFEQHGRVDDAIEGYEALYKRNPRTQRFAANNLAMLLVTYRTDRASLDRARDLIAGFASSDDSNLLDTAGWVCFKRGEFREALPALERARERAPDSKVIRYHLGMAELQLGMKDRARSNLEAALSGAGSFQGAEEARVALASLKEKARA